MANIDNLIPLGNDPERDKKIRQMGQKKAVEARNRRTKLKEELALVLETRTNNGLTIQQNWAKALAKQLLQGNIPASVFVRDTIGEKPVDKLEVKQDISQLINDIEEFIDVDKETD